MPDLRWLYIAVIATVVSVVVHRTETDPPAWYANRGTKLLILQAEIQFWCLVLLAVTWNLSQKAVMDGGKAEARVVASNEHSRSRRNLTTTSLDLMG